MGAMKPQITSLTIVYSNVYSDADQRKHQSSASLAFVREIQRGPVNSPLKWPVTRKMFPFDDVITIDTFLSAWRIYMLPHFRQLRIIVSLPWTYIRPKTIVVVSDVFPCACPHICSSVPIHIWFSIGPIDFDWTMIFYMFCDISSVLSYSDSKTAGCYPSRTF